MAPYTDAEERRLGGRDYPKDNKAPALQNASLPWQASKKHWVELKLPHPMQENVGVEVESVQRMTGWCRKKKTTGRC